MTLTRISAPTALKLLNRQLFDGHTLMTNRPLSSESHEYWEITTAAHLKTIYGSNSDEDEAVFRHKWARSVSINATNEQREEARARELERQLAALQSIADTLDTYVSLGLVGGGGIVDGELSSQVFVIHGQNEASKHAVARFLEQLGLEPVILHERPSKGRTIIEKFEEHSQVGFAVALLTADDRGGPKGSIVLQARARQNVIFELGYFLGRIGRRRVAALYEDGVEIPSDYAGVVYIPLDAAGGWQMILAREMRDAGLSVDLNKLT